MSESLTGNPSDNQPASNEEPTGQEHQNNPADVENQEATSREQSQEAVSGNTAEQNNAEKQTQQKQNSSGQPETDDSLAKFAKSQGFDPENLTDGEKRALKIAHDNQKAYRNSSNQKLTESVNGLEQPKQNETEDDELRREMRQYKYEREADRFFESKDSAGQPRNRALESTMVEILNEKREKYGDDYAFSLSRDFDSLYDMARFRSGAEGAGANQEDIRREERESIKKQSLASAPRTHATETRPEGPKKVDENWIKNEYDPRNPEHIKLLQEAGLR